MIIEVFLTLYDNIKTSDVKVITLRKSVRFSNVAKSLRRNGVVLGKRR